MQKLAASKRAKVVRESGDFDSRALQQFLTAPYTAPGAYSWSIDDIVKARDQQMVGRFRLPARLAESFSTNAALFTARSVRLAPVQSLDVRIEAGRGPRADKIADEAEALFGMRGVAISSQTITTIRTHLADHGVAFAANIWRPRADGSRVDVELVAWPIEFVWWHAYLNCYVTQVRHYNEEPGDPTAMTLLPGAMPISQPLEPIVHGNGRWVVFQKSQVLPHRFDAALLSAALVWATSAFAERDWNKGSASHGNAKVVGELPDGTPLTDAVGALTAEAAAFLQLVQAVASQEAPAGIRPAGSKIDYMTNTSRAWEVWKELGEKAERAAARIYLGTDGVLGAQGGAPGVDVQALFGVATSKIASDLTCIGDGIETGTMSPWAAINFGDDKQAPTRKYVFPDPEESQVRDDFSKRNAAFLAAVKAARDAGFDISPEYVAAVACEYGVPVPQLAGAAPMPALPAAAPSGATG